MAGDKSKSTDQTGDPSLVCFTEITSLFDRYLEVATKVGCHAMSPEEGRQSVRAILREMRLKGYDA
jgi:hypothetical protein